MRRSYLHLMLLASLLVPGALLRAQSVDWQEHRTLLFTILYPSGAEAIAEQYAQFVDSTYEEAAAVWAYRTAPPIVLRIYPTMDLYYEANPIAARLPGVVAHAHTGRREISVAIPQTAGQSPEEITNNVRHELTHIIAADLSGGRLTTPWQEGIAQFVEHPSPQLDEKMQLMRQIISEDRLLSWRELNQPGATYADPRVGYPQSLTIVAFLIQRNGMARYREYVEEMKDSSGYRSALEKVYGTSADLLEKEWRAALPQFVTEGYKSGTDSNLPTTFDLDPATQLVTQGDYSGAIRVLRGLIPTIVAANDAIVLQRAKSLLARAEAGQRGAGLAADARAALLRGDYPAATTASLAAQRQFDSIGQSEQVALLVEYEQLAERGRAAEVNLNQAGALLRRFQLVDARDLLVSSYTTFVELGDQRRAEQAQSTLMFIARGEQLLTALCFIIAVVLIAWSARRRATERRLALPFG